MVSLGNTKEEIPMSKRTARRRHAVRKRTIFMLLGAIRQEITWMPISKLFLILLLTLLASCAKDGRVITVGSKNFTENILLAELVAQHIEAV